LIGKAGAGINNVINNQQHRSCPDGCHIHFHLMVDGKKSFLAPAIFTPEIVKAFHKQCNGFKESNDGTAIPPCMGYRIGAEENPFGSGAKGEL
jgi:hypothetical protein